MIGNSFSDDTIEYAHQIAYSLGYGDFEVCNLYIGGCSIDMHYKNVLNNSRLYEFRVFTGGQWSTIYDMSIQDGINFKNKKWDAITFQQSSPDSGFIETYKNVDNLIDKIKQIIPYNFLKLWNMTWAYQKDSTHPKFINYNNNQDFMYNKIVEVNKKFISENENFDGIIPIGVSIQNARKILGDTLTRDGYHLSYDVGRYIAGLTLIKTIYKSEIPYDIYCPDSISKSIKDICIDVVNISCIK